MALFALVPCGYRPMSWIPSKPGLYLYSSPKKSTFCTREVPLQFYVLYVGGAHSASASRGRSMTTSYCSLVAYCNNMAELRFIGPLHAYAVAKSYSVK